MKTNKHILGLLLLGLGLTTTVSSCRQSYEEVDGATKKGFYDAPRQVYFSLLNGTVPNFAYGKASYTATGQEVNSGELASTETLVRVDVPVRISGTTPSEDLTFSIMALADTTGTMTASDSEVRPQAAVVDVDYQPFESSYKIPAGQVSTTIPIYFKRSGISGAGEAGKVLSIELRSTADLQTRFTANAVYRIRVVDELTEPELWTMGGPYGQWFGAFSAEKYRLMIADLGSDFFARLEADSNRWQVKYFVPLAQMVVRLAAAHPDMGFNPTAAAVFLP